MFTFTHIRAAPDFALVLGTFGIYTSAKLQQSRRVPFRGVGNYLFEQVLQPFRLRKMSCCLNVQISIAFTFNMVVMKTELAFERQKNIVDGLDLALSFLTALIIAGCFISAK